MLLQHRLFINKIQNKYKKSLLHIQTKHHYFIFFTIEEKEPWTLEALLQVSI